MSKHHIRKNRHSSYKKPTDSICRSYSKRNFLNWDLKKSQLCLKSTLQDFSVFSNKNCEGAASSTVTINSKKKLEKILLVLRHLPVSHTTANTSGENASRGAARHPSHPIIMRRSMRLALCKLDALLTRNPRMKQNHFPQSKANPSPVNFVTVYCYTVFSALNCMNASISS